MINNNQTNRFLSNQKYSNQIFFFLVYVICCLCITTNKSLAAINPLKKTQGEIKILIKPVATNGLFNEKSKVEYHLLIDNGLLEAQEGAIGYVVKKEAVVLLQNSFDINIPAKKKLKTVFTIPHSEEGSFDIYFTIELNKKISTINFKFSFSKSKKFAKSSKEKQDVEEPNEEEGDIQVIMKPVKADGVFKGKNPIVYNVLVKNTHTDTQEGTISYTVKDAVKGVLWTEKIYDVKLAKKSSKRMQFIIPAPEKPGLYNIDLNINTTSYEDTTRHSFGYEIDYINSPLHKPADFDAFWNDALQELAKINPAYQITEAPEKTTAEYKVYKVEMNSLENVKIFGWLTIPKTWIKGKKFPVVVIYPGYQVMMNPLFFYDYIGLSLNVRGMDKKSEAYPIPDGEEVLTYNIQEKEKYIYRGIYMDCIRGIDFLFANEHLGFDLNRITVLGGSQGASLALVVAALKNKIINTCIADVPIYCDMHMNLEMEPQIKEEAFTFKYINRFLNKQAGVFTKEQFLQNFSYFEVQNFIPQINCSVLMAAAFKDALAPASTVFCGFNKLNPKVRQKSEIYTFPDLAHEIPDVHNLFKTIWMTEKLANRIKK
ncbi:MAG: acetylxylan esterase [Bacteroidetes bacterium]|nr:acetylxylan esterase [Bacteroidota bacterium]